MIFSIEGHWEEKTVLMCYILLLMVFGYFVFLVFFKQSHGKNGILFFVLLTEPTFNGNSYVLKSDYLFINHCFMVYSYSLEYC